MKQVNKKMNNKTKLVWKERIIGSRKISNFGWALLTFLGSISFFFVGFSSFLGTNLIPGLNSKEITFLPQGLVMCFYGLLGCLLSFYLGFILLWNIGEGYNEFNKQTGELKFFRWGFPGQNRRIQMVYPMEDIESLRLEFKEGINPTRTLYIRLLTSTQLNFSDQAQGGGGSASINSLSNPRKINEKSKTSFGKVEQQEILLPLTQIGEPLTFIEIEEKAADLASFLQVSIENIR